MYVGRDFDPVGDNSGQIFAFDLAATLSVGETISAALSSLILENGADASPYIHLIPPAIISGSQIAQMIAWNDPIGVLVGNTYVFFVNARTSTGEIIIPWSRISVQQGYGGTAFIGGSAPQAAEVFVLPAPGPLFILPTSGGYALRDFPEMDQGEQRFLGFDFSPLLSPGETIVTATPSMWVTVGTDDTIAQTPTAYFVGTTAISGSVAQQLVSIPPAAALVSRPPQVPDLSGVVYAFNIAARTSFGQGIGTWSRLRVRSFYA